MGNLPVQTAAMIGGPLRRGCRRLAMFPSVDSVRRLAAAALDPAAPPPVRDEAIASLGCRQIRAMPPETRWSAEAVQLLLSRARTAALAHVLAA